MTKTITLANVHEEDTKSYAGIYRVERSTSCLGASSESYWERSSVAQCTNKRTKRPHTETNQRNSTEISLFGVLHIITASSVQ